MLDCINNEILRIKHELAERHGNDVTLILADARAKQRGAVRLPSAGESEQSDPPKPPVTRFQNGSSTPATG
jgi:hypothetical protein